MRRRTLLASLPVAMGAASAAAQPRWPRQPLRRIVVYPPGGLSDGMARLLAERLQAQLGVAVRVDNRAGGGGSVGLQALARAAPDGHTLAYSAVSPLTLRPHLQADGTGVDPLRGIAPVAGVMFTPVLVVGTPAFTGRDFAALLAQARARPGALRWATSGIATAGHLVLEQVQAGAGVRVTHVPYKGGGQQLNDALAGQFELLSTNVAAAQLHLAAPAALQAQLALLVRPAARIVGRIGIQRGQRQRRQLRCRPAGQLRQCVVGQRNPSGLRRRCQGLYTHRCVGGSGLAGGCRDAQAPGDRLLQHLYLGLDGRPGVGEQLVDERLLHFIAELLELGERW